MWNILKHYLFFPFLSFSFLHFPPPHPCPQIFFFTIDFSLRTTREPTASCLLATLFTCRYVANPKATLSCCTVDTAFSHPETWIENTSQYFSIQLMIHFQRRNVAQRILYTYKSFKYRSILEILDKYIFNTIVWQFFRILNSRFPFGLKIRKREKI